MREIPVLRSYSSCLALALLSTLLLLGCETPRSQLDSNQRIVLNTVELCSAGLGSGQSGNFDLAADFSEALKEGKVDAKLGASVSNWTRGYIVEKLEQFPEQDRLKVYNGFRDCVDKHLPGFMAGIDPAFAVLRERTQTLWNDYAEAIRLENPIPLDTVDKYVTAGTALASLRERDLDLKNRLMVFERESLMYAIATEIVIRSGATVDAVGALSVEELPKLAYVAAKGARDTYIRILKEAPDNMHFFDWIARENINYLTLTRLSDSLAQRYYLDNNVSSLDELNVVIMELPCGFIREKKLEKDVTYARLSPLPQRLTECST